MSGFDSWRVPRIQKKELFMCCWLSPVYHGEGASKIYGYPNIMELCHGWLTNIFIYVKLVSKPHGCVSMTMLPQSGIYEWRWGVNLVQNIGGLLQQSDVGVVGWCLDGIWGISVTLLVSLRFLNRICILYIERHNCKYYVPTMCNEAISSMCTLCVQVLQNLLTHNTQNSSYQS